MILSKTTIIKAIDDHLNAINDLLALYPEDDTRVRKAIISKIAGIPINELNLYYIDQLFK